MGDGRAKGSSATGGGGQALIASMPDADGAGSGPLPDQFCLLFSCSVVSGSL